MLSPDCPLPLGKEDLEAARKVLENGLAAQPWPAGAGPLPHSHLGALHRVLWILHEAVRDQGGLKDEDGTTGLPPLPTLGIYGHWGTGKSTVLRWCQQVLEAAGWPVIRFEAWRYQGDGDPMVALLEELYWWAEGRTTLRRRITNFLKRWETVAAAGVFSVLGIVSRLATGVDLSDPVKAMARAGEQLGVPRSEHRKLRESLDTIIAEVRRGGDDRPLVILVDDLDRCLPDRAWRILETLRVHFLSSDVTYVLALEPDIVAAHIEQIYGEKLGKPGFPVVDGQRFLDRLVSHHFRLRTMRFRDVAERLNAAGRPYFEDTLLGAVAATPALQEASWVPRIWVQLLNQLQYGESRPVAGDPLPDADLLKTLLAVFRDVARAMSGTGYAALEPRIRGKERIPVDELFHYSGNEEAWRGPGRLSELLDVLGGLC